jgi:hypothetical protein
MCVGAKIGVKAGTTVEYGYKCLQPPNCFVKPLVFYDSFYEVAKNKTLQISMA